MGLGQVQISVDVAGHPSSVSPYLFGNFIEHIRDCVEVLWGEKVRNRDFASPTPQCSEPPAPWEVAEGAVTAGVRSPAEGALPTGIVIAASGGGRGAIRQGGIAIKRGARYIFRIRLDSQGEVKNVTIGLADREGEKLASASVNETRGECSVGLVSSRASQSAYVEVCFDGTGKLVVDYVSLMPADVVDGIPSSVLEMIQELQPTILRYPGGCFADTYHWQDGVGPIDERPNKENLHWKGLEPNDFGTDEFVALCRNVLCEPLICVNFGSGTPEEAAAWVEYCNGGPDSQWGGLRSRNGHSEPFGVRFWEVGNEIYGKWEAGHCSADEYARRYLEFAQAMKAADPNIKLLAVGHTSEDWNRAVLTAATKEMDFLTMHFYHRPPEGMEAEELFRFMAAGAQKYGEIIGRTASLIGEICGGNGPKIAVTEWNTMYRRPAERTAFPREHTIEAALFNAGLLNAFIRNSEIVKVCTFSDLINGWVGGCIRVGDCLADVSDTPAPPSSGHDAEMVYGTPTYHVLRLYAKNVPASYVPTVVESPAFSVGELGEVPYVDAAATVSEAGDALSLFAINRDLLEEREATMTLKGFEPGARARVFTVAGDSPDDANIPTNPEAIAAMETGLAVKSSEICYKLPPCSLTAFTFHRE